MTDTIEAPVDHAVEQTSPATGEEQKTDEGPKRRPNDFTKHRDFHKDIADFINAHDEYKAAGLPELSPQQVKAVMVLRTEFADTPEQKAKREEAKKAQEEAKKKYEGLTEDQIKAQKAAEKAADQAARFAAKAAEAEQRAAEAKAAADASKAGGTPAKVETAEAPVEEPAKAPAKKLGQRR